MNDSIVAEKNGVKRIIPKKVHLRQNWTLVFNGTHDYGKIDKKKPIIFKSNMMDILKSRHKKWYTRIERLKR